MAGIGPVCLNTEDVLKRAHRRMALAATASELEIFYHLCVGRVSYRSNTHMLYYVDSPIVSITDTIVSVFRGLRQQPQINQLYMDRHNLIKAAYRLCLADGQCAPVLAALRLRGVRIDIS